MEITKPNDILVATLNNPNSSPYDFMTEDITPDNTSLFTKDEYKSTDYVKKTFTDKDGKFDDTKFNEMYNKAAAYYKAISDDKFLKDLTTLEYSPFDITRPVNAKTFDTEVVFDLDFNPFKELYSRRGINSIEDNPLSLRELAQQGKIYDPSTNTWSETSANDLGIFDKWFGDTLVYGQWDADGIHKDPRTGYSVQHKKGEWKYDDNGNLFLEKLGDREVYGKQVVNPMDILTDDGSLANKYIDIWDADSKEKSIAKSTAKLVFDIAPFLIPGAGQVYGGLKAAIGLSSILPTFYKAMEGILLGGESSSKWATNAEGYMAKFVQSSVSDKNAESLLNYEQLSQIVGDVFSQLYEQRAAASLSLLIKKVDLNKLGDAEKTILTKINADLGDQLLKNKLSLEQALDLRDAAIKKVPQLQSILEERNKLAKSLSLGYMALTQSSAVYGEAISGGYDRRTAGFAALTAAAGQYGIMANNRMGDWFLDNTVGYSTQQSKAQMIKTLKPFLGEIEEAFKGAKANPIKARKSLSSIVTNIKHKLEDTFITPSVIGEALIKNSLVEGFEEVTEQAVLDATKGIVDVMSYLGMTAKPGTFGGIQNVFSEKGFQNYLANFVGGLLGGAVFEVQRAKIEPLLGRVSPETKSDIYELIADGNLNKMVDYIKSSKHKFGNSYVSTLKEDGTFDPASPTKMSQADLIANKAIEMLNYIDGLINSQDLGHSDEEVVAKALRDGLILKDLREFRGDSKIGIEGLILRDYKKNLTKIVNLTAEINSVTGTEDKDKEAVKRLNEERNVYKANIDQILTGELAEKYFTNALLYFTLAKEIAVLDKNTFVKTTYGKNYNDLADSGLGLTKERVNKEYNDYIKSADLSEYIDITSNAIQNLEQMSNQSLADYALNYADVRNATYKTFLNNINTEKLFGASNEENRIKQVSNFIQVAKDIEAETGVRVVPWDSIINNFANQIVATTGFKINNGNEKITYKGMATTKKDLAVQVLTNIITAMPPDQISFNIIAEYFNSQIESINQTIFSEDTGKATSLLQEKQSLIEELEALSKATSAVQGPEESDEAYTTRFEETRAKHEKIIKRLEEIQLALLKIGVDASLVPYEESEDYLTKFSMLESSIRQKHGMDDATIAAFESNSSKGLNPIDLKSTIPNNLLELRAIGELVQSDYSILEEAYGLLKQSLDIAGVDATNKESILATGTYKGKLQPQVKELVKNFMEMYKNSVEQANLLVSSYNKSLNSYQAYKQDIENLREDFAKNIPDIYGLHNLLLVELIRELQNGSLDGELLIQAEKLIVDFYDNLANKMPDFAFSAEDIRKIISLSDAQIDSIYNQIGAALSELDQFDNLFGDIPNERIKAIIDDLIKANKKVVELDPDSIEYQQWASDAGNLIQIQKFLSHVKENRILFEPIQKLVDVTTNKTKFKINTLYDFLRNKFDIYLDRNTKMSVMKVMSLLEDEELKLRLGPSVESYFYSGDTAADIKQAINTFKLLKTVIKGLSTTEVGYGDPYGIIASRQAFAKKHKIDADVLKLQTLPSDIVTLMHQDIDRIITKLEFYLDVAKHNSGLISKEQKIIQENFNKLLIERWQNLVKLSINVRGKAFIPDIDDILKSKDNIEKKLARIEEAVFENVDTWTQEEKLELGKILADQLRYNNVLKDIYKEDSSEITRDIKVISNNDLLVYLLSTISMNSKDFNITLAKALKKFDKAPFFTQKLGLRIMYASLLNKELFSETLKELSPIEGKKDISDVWTHDTSLITYIFGSAGTGKTTVMYKLLLLMLGETNENISVWFSAPKNTQAAKLKKDVLEGTPDKIQSEVLEKQKLLERLGLRDVLDRIRKDMPKDITLTNQGEFLKINENSYFGMAELESMLDQIQFPNDLPNLILIDEITHFTALEQHLLNEVSKRTGVKIYGAGDIYQKGIDFNKINYNVDRVSGIFAPNLFLTIRAQNNQKRYNNQLLFSISRQINKVWKNGHQSNSTIFDTVLKEGLTLNYFRNENTLNGEIIVPKLSSDLLRTLGNNIKQNPDAIIGILSEEEISEELKAQLEAYGIKENNYVIVDPDSVQGQEFDYFVFNLSTVGKEKSIYDAIKALYTYISRAKNGTIIVKDSSVTYAGRELKLVSSENQLTEEVVPLDNSIIADLLKEEQSILEDLTDKADTIKNPFYFDKEMAKIPFILPEISTSTETDTVDATLDIGDQDVKFSLAKAGETKENSTRIMLHTFYHDSNTKVRKVKVDGQDRIELTKNEGIPAQLSYLFKGGKKTITLSEEEYKDALNMIVTEKFNVLSSNNGRVSDEALRIIFDNPMLTRDSVSQELVVFAASYDDTYNAPRELLYDDANKHINKKLNNKSKYINLSIKLTNTKDTGEEYYLHLGTFPDIDTLTKFATDNNNKKLTSLYKGLLDVLTLKGNKKFMVLPVKRENLLLFTSTRLYKDVNNPIKNIEDINTFERLISLPGLKFFNSNNEEVNKPMVLFFPPTFDKFKELYKGINFASPLQPDGSPMSEEQLKELFEGPPGKPHLGKRNKPYIAVSYIYGEEQTTSSIRFLPLHSRKRTWKEILSIIEEGDFLRKGAEAGEKRRNALTEAEKQRAIQEADNISVITDTLFSGNDIINLLVDLAEKAPELLERFIADGREEFHKVFGGKTEAQKETIRKMFGALGKSIETSIWNLVTAHEGSDLILETALKWSKSSDKTNRKVLKKELVEIAKSDKGRYWFTKFWKLIALNNKYQAENEDEFGNVFTKEINAKISKDLKDIVDFWMKNTKELFYNIPVSWNRVKNQLQGNMDAKDIFSMTFSTLDIEGPRLLLDLTNIGNIVLDSTVEKEALLDEWEADASINTEILREMISYLKISKVAPNAGFKTLKTKLMMHSSSVKELIEAKVAATGNVQKANIIKAINSYYPNIMATLSMSMPQLEEMLKKLDIIKQIKSFDITLDETELIKWDVSLLSSKLGELERGGKRDVTADVNKLKLAVMNLIVSNLNDAKKEFVSWLEDNSSSGTRNAESEEEKLKIGTLLYEQFKLARDNTKILSDSLDELLVTSKGVLSNEEAKLLASLVFDIQDLC